MNCVYCKDEVFGGKCRKCGMKLINICPDCHNETKHNVVKNQNIHICGGMPSPLDPDAYGTTGVSLQNECYGLPVF